MISKNYSFMKESEFATFIADMNLFKGEMNDLANSIEVVMELIFKKIGLKSPKMLGKKIQIFTKHKPIISKNYLGDFDELVYRLNKFNEIWIVTKHGMTVGGIKKPTVHKDGICYTFDEKTRLEIKNDFSQIMENLIEISKLDYG